MILFRGADGRALTTEDLRGVTGALRYRDRADFAVKRRFAESVGEYGQAN